MMQGTILILLTTRIEGYNLTLFEAGQTVMKLRLSPDRWNMHDHGSTRRRLFGALSCTSCRASDNHIIISQFGVTGLGVHQSLF